MLWSAAGASWTMIPKISSRERLGGLARTRPWLMKLTPDEIDTAIRLVEALESIGSMDPKEAAEWRWRIMACWAEHQRAGHPRAEEAQKSSLE